MPFPGLFLTQYFTPASFTYIIRLCGRRWAAIDFKECLQYAEGVVQHLSGLPDNKKRRFQKAIASTKARAGNPYLHIALIGDFSAGKSTFINALLKQELLKTAWYATTAVPTLIYHQEQEGIRILVETQNGEKFQMDQPDQRGLLERTLGVRLPPEEHEMIALLSTSNELAKGSQLGQMDLARERYWASPFRRTKERKYRQRLRISTQIPWGRKLDEIVPLLGIEAKSKPNA